MYTAFMIPLFKVFMPKSVKKPLLQTLFSGYIGQGPQVEVFEEILRNYLQTKYVLTLNSGTSALHLALKLANIMPGDEVISTPLTCAATNWPILSAGAKIVWADIDLKTANISPESIAKKITKKTKAIMVVDWGGHPADMDAIKKIAYRMENGKKVKIPIIEDAAHALGSEYKNKKTANQADYTCFSLQAIKHITTVDGGLLVTKNKEDYERGKLLRWYGISRSTKNRDSRIEEDVFEHGYKYHMNDVNATIGIEQMKYLEEIIAKHRDNAAFFTENLHDCKGITVLTEQKYAKSSYWLYTLRADNRNKLRDHLRINGVMASQVHRRNDTHPVVKQFRTVLPDLDTFEKEMLCIPVGWWLTKKDLQKIVRAIQTASYL